MPNVETIISAMFLQAKLRVFFNKFWFYFLLKCAHKHKRPTGIWIPCVGVKVYVEVCRSCGGAISYDGCKLGSYQSAVSESVLRLQRRYGLLSTGFMANWWPLSQPISFPKQRYFCTDALGSWCTTCPVVLQITGSTVPMPLGPAVMEWK